MAASHLTTTDGTPSERARSRSREKAREKGNETAVASFVLGLLGLFVFNVVLGPLALVLAVVSLVRGTERRGRALIGLALGVADLAVLGVMIAAHPGGATLHLGI